MKNTIGRKLTTSGLVVLLFILLIFAASQIAVGLFKNTSENLIVEYHELDAIQEFKLTLGMLLISSNYYDVHREEQYHQQFCDEVLNAKTKLGGCYEVITDRHDRGLLDELSSAVLTIDKLTVEMLEYSIVKDFNNQVLLDEVKEEINKSYSIIEILLAQTKLEIREYESINKTVIRHSTYTFLTLGILVIAILILRGLTVIRSVTRPIKELVTTSNKIIKGDRKAKVNIQSKDEFYTLANSFNKMLESLEQTTVSKNYLNNILENMFDALIVTNRDMKIRSTNRSALELLGYPEPELLGADINIIFNEDTQLKHDESSNEEELINQKHKINLANQIKTKSGQLIPALLSCTELKDHKGNISGLIIVGHDLREQYMIERKLEQSRRESIILINDAQEEERIRIAMDLHDGMGQMLTAISYAIQDLFPEEDLRDTKRKDVINIQQQIDDAIKEAKSIAQDLIPIVLKDFGLIAAIENLIRKANELEKTKFTFNAFDFNERIDPKLEKALYRICQETVNNIIKHASAENATYQIFRQNNGIVLVIEDDGLGFDPEYKDQNIQKPGIGLISIKERVQAFEGTFILNSTPSSGTEIIIEIPCRKA